MAQLALYRKYRSQTFGDLVGQEHVVRTLLNAFTTGRVAQSFLFTGPRGTGKTSTARLVAKALSCSDRQGAEPCNTCVNCLAISDGSSLDVMEVDAASEAGVDDVRERIIASAEYMPVSAPYRVFIIDEVHDLSAKAFDALLKTIEEPPPHAIFILATTEFHKVPATIRSRCQKFEFHRASIGNLADRIRYVAEAEGYEIDGPAVQTIARMADGGYRDALSLLEQLLLTCEGKLTLDHVMDQLGLIQNDSVDKILVGMAQGAPDMVISGLDETYQLGRDPRSILEACLSRVSDITRALYNVDPTAKGDATAEATARDVASQIGPERLTRIREVIASAHKSVKDVTLPKVWLESWLVSAAFPKEAPVPAPRVESAKPAPVPKAAVVAKAPTNPWAQVVEQLSSQSALARMHLDKTSVAKETDSEVVVSFDRAMDLDWVNEKQKVLGAILTAWREQDTQGRKLTFKVGGNGVKPQATHEAAVELPAEGEKLHELAKEVFEEN